ncbi:tRNA (carboxymethyluridine(34)-5-O)-methyltransferase [Leucoagaricus sp. SymC.cos]|nr:tRNA (carboxymethyluridine(34)-5-O)-methyltransferase [Leucoagaricus sp. SymC.cos]
MAPKAVAEVTVDQNPEAYEVQNVHAIYDKIASHFSSTRYKPWPIIAKFLSELPTGWIGLDSGTGNGKYLPLDRQGDIWTIGLDRSINLLKIAERAGGKQREVVLGNVLDLCWRTHAFDYAISIATIHHLATPERRMLAVQRLLQSVASDHGRVLIYVWAIEQDELSKRVIPQGELDNTKLGRDVVVPWVRSHQNTSESSSPSEESQEQIYNRYYHMFAKGELTGLVIEAAKELDLVIGIAADQPTSTQGIEIVQDGWERSNHYVELRRWTIP